jgi:hypothetical protein
MVIHNVGELNDILNEFEMRESGDADVEWWWLEIDLDVSRKV